MVKRIVAGFVILLIAGSSVAQCVAADLFFDVGDRLTPNTDQKRTAKEEARLSQEKAVWVLKNIIAQADSPDILERQAAVISGAAELVWTRDERFARESFNRTITILIQEYEAELKAAKPRRPKLSDLSEAISTFIRSLARRDSALALSMLKEYQKTRASAVNDTSSKQTSKEKMEIIREGLDLDPQESARLAANLLKSGIPSSFPQYLNDLAARDNHAADDLYHLAVTLSTSSPRYDSSGVSFLSAYPFREGAIILPAVDMGGEDGRKLSIGIFTSPLSRSGETAEINLAIAKNYVRAMYPYLNRAASLGISEPASAARSLFLVHKLTGYVTRLKLDELARWEELNSNYEILAKNNGLDDSNLKYLVGYADRIANEQVAFLFDNGASLFRKANDTLDAKQRTDFLVRGIKELVEGKDFEEAGKRIGDVDDQSLRKLLSDYLSFAAGREAAGSRDWQETLHRYGRIYNPQLRSLLMLESVRFVKKTGKSKRNERLILDLLGRAMEDLSKVENQAYKAQGLLATAASMATVDPDRTIPIVNEAIEAINKANDYDGNDYAAQIIISSVDLDFILEDSDLESAFKEIAKIDWSSVMALIDRLEPKLLRNRAQLGACRAVLQSAIND